MQQTEKHFWSDVARLIKEYWAEVAILFIVLSVFFAAGIYIF